MPNGRNQKRDNHINTYEQLSTITAAVNYIETGTPWKHIVKQNNKFYEIYYWKTFSTNSNIDSKSSPHFTIEIKSDTEVIFKVHKKVQFNQ